MCEFSGNLAPTIKMWQVKVIPFAADLTKIAKYKKFHSVKEVRSLGLKLLVLCQYKWFRVILSVLTVGLFSSAFALSTYGKLLRKDRVSRVVLVIDHFSHFLLTASNIIAIHVVLKYRKYNKVISTILDYISAKQSTKAAFGLISNLFNVICFISVGLNFYFFSILLGYTISLFYVLRDLQFTFLNISLYSLTELNYCIKEMFFDVNQDLQSLIDAYLVSVSKTAKDTNATTTERSKKIDEILDKLKKICIRHNKLCEHMDDLNSLTGPTTLLAVINIIANIVWAVTIFVEYDIPNVMAFYHDDGVAKVPLNALICNSMMNLLWIFTMMGQAVMLAATGRLLTLEGQTTITLCYTFLHQQKIGAKESYNDLMLKNRLSLLAKQAKSRCPIFSAAGFFPVDLSILGLITSTAFAFTIVVIQFILNDNRG